MSSPLSQAWDVIDIEQRILKLTDEEYDAYDEELNAPSLAGTEESSKQSPAKESWMNRLASGARGRLGRAKGAPAPVPVPPAAPKPKTHAEIGNEQVGEAAEEEEFVPDWGREVGGQAGFGHAFMNPGKNPLIQEHLSNRQSAQFNTIQ